MIIVVEGISASGKTTWHTRNSGYHLVAENGPRPDAPDAVQDPWGGGGGAGGMNRVHRYPVPDSDRR